MCIAKKHAVMRAPATPLPPPQSQHQMRGILRANPKLQTLTPHSLKTDKHISSLLLGTEGVKKVHPRVQVLSHRMYLFLICRNSTPQLNRRLAVYYYYRVDGFVGELIF